MTQATQPNHHTLQQAAQWFATLSDEQVTESDKTDWKTWINDHPEHQQAWQYVERIGQRFQLAQQQAGSAGSEKILNTTINHRINRRKVLSSGLICMSAWLSWRHTPLPAITQRIANTWAADHQTATGQTRQFSLTDGGQLWLNTDSAVDINYRNDIRQIDLHRGEVLIQTAKDPQQRPFIVNTQQGHLRALGTRFTVQQYNHNTTLLAVYEGAVEINTAQGQRNILQAGEQTIFSANSIQASQPSQRSRQAWSKGLIVAEDITLKKLVAELSRYRHGHLGIDPAVAELTVIGTYPIDKPDHALAMLENALPIKVNKLLPWWVTLEAN